MDGLISLALLIHLVSVVFSSAALCLTCSRDDDMVPAVNALISYLTEPVTNSLHIPLSVSPVGEPFSWDLTPSPAAPCSVPFIFVHSMPILISPDSPLPLLTCTRMKRWGTSLLLWLPQRARIKWISHHSDAHVKWKWKWKWKWSPISLISPVSVQYFLQFGNCGEGPLKM